MNKIIKGKTHCDNIGDYFRNPFLTSLIVRYYQGMNKSTLTIWKNKKDKKFSPEFYEFIREIFHDGNDMKKFLIYIREELLSKPKLKSKLHRYCDNDDLMKALLCFEEINDQLHTTNALTIKGIFNTKIIDILRVAQVSESHDWYAENEQYWNPPILRSLGNAFDKWIMPISNRWDILWYIDADESKHIMAIIWEEKIIEVNHIWEYLENPDTSKRILKIQQINRYIKIYKYFEQNFIDADNWESFILEKKEEGIYNTLMKDYLTHSTDSQEDIEDDSIEWRLFLEWLWDEIGEAKKDLEDTAPQDETQIKKWKDKNITPGIQKQLPDIAPTQMFPANSWKPILKVIK